MNFAREPGTTTAILRRSPGNICARPSVSEVNLDRLRHLAGHLRNACRQLQEIGKQDGKAFLSDAKAVNSAKYLVIVATEAALDICDHLAAKKGGAEPGRLRRLHDGPRRVGRTGA
jgi:hypothetical protein